MGWFSDVFSSASSSAASSLGSGVNSWLRYIDSGTGGIFGIDAANKYGITADAEANAEAQADFYANYYPEIAVNMVKAQKNALVQNGYNPLLAVDGAGSNLGGITLGNQRAAQGVAGNATSAKEYSILQDQKDEIKSRILANNTASANSVKKTDAEVRLADAQIANLQQSTERGRYIPINQSNNGGLKIFGSGFDIGSSKTYLFDTETGMIFAPHDPNSAKSTNDVSDAIKSYDKHKSNYLYNLPR